MTASERGEAVAELIADPSKWEANDGRWDPIDTLIQVYRRDGLSFRAIADRPDIPLGYSAVRDRWRRRQLTPSTELLCAFMAEQYDEHDRLMMEARAASTLQKREYIDAQTGERVLVDTDPRLVQTGLTLQLKILEKQRDVLAGLEVINQMLAAKARHEGLDEVEAARAEVLELLPRFLPAAKDEDDEDDDDVVDEG